MTAGDSPQPEGARSPWLDESRAMLRLALPLVITQLGQIGITTTDMVMTGWLGPEQLAAGILGMQTYIVVWLFCLGVLIAVSPLAAQAWGARDVRGVRRTVRQGLWMAVALGLPAGLLLWHVGALFVLLRQDPDTAALAGSYVRMMVFGFVPHLCFVVLRAFVSSLSRPRAAMTAMLVCLPLNALLNYAFMFGNFGMPRLGLVGAGVASSLVHLCMFGGLLGYILIDRQFRRFAILVRFLTPDWQRFRDIFRIGWPIGLALLGESGLFTLTTILMGWVGTEALAAHAIAMQCAAAAFMVPLGIGQAATVRVGQAVGRRDRSGIGRAGWTALATGLVFMSFTATVMLLLPELLASAFIDISAPENALVLVYAKSFLMIAAMFQFADGAQVIGAQCLRGLSDTRVPMLYALGGYWGLGFGSAWLLGFPLNLGGIGIWLGLALGLTLVAILMVRRFHLRDRLGLVPTPGALRRRAGVTVEAVP